MMGNPAFWAWQRLVLSRMTGGALRAAEKSRLESQLKAILGIAA